MKIEKGMVFTITSDVIATKSIPAQFGKIFSIVEKEMPAKTMTKEYVIEEVSDDFVTVHEKDIKESKYTIAKKDFGKANPKVGETYKIETSEEILTSEPAQFAAIYKVELTKEAPKENNKQEKSWRRNYKAPQMVNVLSWSIQLSRFKSIYNEVLKVPLYINLNFYASCFHFFEVFFNFP